MPRIKTWDEVLFDGDIHEIQGKVCLDTLIHRDDVVFVNDEKRINVRHASPDGKDPVTYELRLI